MKFKLVQMGENVYFMVLVLFGFKMHTSHKEKVEMLILTFSPADEMCSKEKSRSAYFEPGGVCAKLNCSQPQ